MYFFPSASAKALSQVGLKGVLGLAIPSVHRANPYTKGKLIGQIEAERKEFADYPEQELALAPHAVYSLSESDWREVASLARVFNLRVNVHVSESQSEIETSKKMFGMSPPQFFESVGLFESPCVAAHAVHVSEEDLDIFRRFNVSVAHNPESNLRLANGICPVVDLRAKGIQVGFGTDSAMTNNDLDLLAEAGTGIKLQSLKYGPGRLSAKDAVTMLTKEAAAILGRGGETGSIELGKSADIQVLDLAGWHAQPRHDPYFSLMYALKSSDVRHHLVAGRVILKDFKIQTLDEAALKKEVQSWSRTLSG
jgi:5-methylthioadenosine/S-adenosylhomocysteine deaminase